MKNTSTRVEKIEGVVTARPCGCCGHHEIGIVTAAGDYIPLKPGMQVRIIRQAGQNTDNASA
ncbi:MAG: hypothetical protein HGJ93_03180 [Desulfosarcina sp.]|nr:hypothetical protein [Desulfosarcina sp.]MBC2764974.1 hypothetical protein [Desulfosarcina sp.]